MNTVYATDEGGRAVRKNYDAVLESWPVPFERLRVPTAQGETFVVACGPVGARDNLLDSCGTRRRLERSVPGATVEVLPRTGHLISGQTRPILDFLRTQERTP